MRSKSIPSADGGAANRDERLPIGEVARRSGVPATAIRYYETIGLLPDPGRAGGKRRYPARVVRHLAFLRAAQQAGFTLREIRDLFAGGTAGFRVSKRWRDAAGRKLAEVAAEAARLLEMERWLRAGLACDCLDVDDCRLAADAAGEAARRVPPRFRGDNLLG